MSISSAVLQSAVARVLGIATIFKDLRGGNIVYLPQRVAVVGQGASASSYSTDKAQVTSAFAAGQAYGFGSPVHLACMKLLPINGDGVGSIPVTVYPLEDAGTGVASAGDITPSGTPTVAASYIVRINNIDSEAFVISVGDTVADIVTAITAAINAVVEMPVIATDSTTVCDLASKWKGVTANDIYVEVIGSETAGNTFAITQPVGGLVNPDVDDALNQIGNVWETLIINCMDIADTATLDKYSTFGEGRWGALVRKPLWVFTGQTNTTVSAATAVSDARTTDRVNVTIPLPGSNELPFVVAARAVSRIAVLANNNPPHDYGSQPLTGLTPGDDGDQWLYADRDTAVKAGCSTVDVRDSVAYMSDTVTMYHPAGDPLPAYRYVVDGIKIQNILFNLNLIFATSEWDGAPLIPDGQPSTNRSAKTRSNAITAISTMIDNLALEAMISDPDTAKASIQAGINGSNPKRLDVAFTVQLSGNTNITSIDFNFGFYIG